MTTSAVTVRMDSTEYSRYYRPTQKITAHVDATGAANGVVVTGTLIRQDGYGTVATKTAVVASAHADVVFDLAVDCNDVKGIYRAKQGRYKVHIIVSDASTNADSDEFDVMVLSVRELKERYLRGVDLRASNTIRPRQQPRTITGVTIDDASDSQFRGVFTMVWDVGAKTLSWGDTQHGQGTAVVVDATTNAEYLLTNKANTAYIQVQVVGELLPTSNKTEAIIMDYDSVEEEELRQFVINAYGEIQGRLYVRLEPTDIDTEDQSSPSYDSSVHTDEYVQPISYYRPEYLKNWLIIKFPHPFLLGISRIEGWFNSSKAFSVPIGDWIVKNQVAGEVEFVAKQGAIMSWQFTGLPFFAFMYTFAHIPSFWHYRLTVGLPDLATDGNRTRVRDCIARYAAIDVLTLAGQASAPGLVGESTSRDGVSESRSYAQGPGGRYANIIQQHQQYLFGADGETGEVKRLKQRLLGLYMVTL